MQSSSRSSESISAADADAAADRYTNVLVDPDRRAPGVCAASREAAMRQTLLSTPASTIQLDPWTLDARGDTR